MKIRSAIFSLYFILLSSLSFSQVAIIDYMQVKPNSVKEYLQLEESWRKVHKERIRVGLIEGWYLYKIRYSGTDSPYQYATISYYKDFHDSENLFFEGVFESALKGMDLDSFFVHTEEIRNFARSEVFARIDGIEYDYRNPAKFIYMNFIKVEQGQEQNYEEIEKYMWKPMHQELVANKKMANWSLWNLWFRTHAEYNYITMNEFYEYEDIDSYNYSEVFDVVHEGKELESMMKNTTSVRNSSKTELWELVDYVVKDK